MTCWSTVAIGLMVIVVGGGATLQIQGREGASVMGSAGAVIIVLGLLGIGC